jgi:hypothetical protein
MSNYGIYLTRTGIGHSSFPVEASPCPLVSEKHFPDPVEPTIGWLIRLFNRSVVGSDDREFENDALAEPVGL